MWVELTCRASVFRAPEAGYWKGWSPPPPQAVSSFLSLQNLKQGFADFSSSFIWAVRSATAPYCLKILNKNDIMAKEITC